MALAREHRLKGSRFFFVLQKKGKHFRSPFFFARVLSSSKGIFKCSVVVSKKIEASAVLRNKIRRRFLEAIRCSLKLFPVPPPYLLLFFPSSQTQQIPFQRLVDDITSFFSSLIVSS
jgi:ribonuclease P protein component